MKQFFTAYEEVAQQDEGTPVDEQFVEFELGELDKDGNPINVRALRAFSPTDGQLTFMLAALGRGQSQDQRYAAIINIMMSTLRDEDQDYFEGRLLSRNPQQQLPIEQIEEIFEYLTEQWFARPTQASSDSATSPQSDGQN